MVKTAAEAQIAGIKAHTEKKAAESLAKAKAAIESLKRRKAVITFKSVAEASGLSRGTLYNCPEIKERIMSLRQTTNPKNIKENKPTVQEKNRAKDILVEKLRERVKKLEQDKHLLIEQLVDYTEIKDENERLKQKVVGLHEKP